VRSLRFFRAGSLTPNGARDPSSQAALLAPIGRCLLAERRWPLAGFSQTSLRWWAFSYANQLLGLAFPVSPTACYGRWLSRLWLNGSMRGSRWSLTPDSGRPHRGLRGFLAGHSPFRLASAISLHLAQPEAEPWWIGQRTAAAGAGRRRALFVALQVA